MFRKKILPKNNSIKDTKFDISNLEKSKYIIFVESPSKVKTIGSLLGKDYCIFATKGHIEDLSRNNLGFDENYNIDYVFLPHIYKQSWYINREQIAKYKDRILFATDNDREGEVISYHIAKFFNIDLKFKKRMIFNEITKDAIINAIDNLRTIDILRVQSQQCRRILDRFIGFKFSPILSSILKPKLSVGRVQSVALNKIYETTLEDLKTKDKFNHYIEITTKLFNLRSNKIPETDIENLYKSVLELKTINNLQFNISVKTLKSPKTLITLSLQIIAFQQLGMSSSRTMMLLQKLYEGNIKNIKHGLITYLRTDSYHVANSFLKITEEYISSDFKNIKYTKIKDNAHESIHPTDLKLTPELLKNVLPTELYKLYKLIYYHYLSSQCKDAIIKTLHIEYKYKDINFSKDIEFIDNQCQLGYLHFYDDKIKILKANYELIKKIQNINTFDIVDIQKLQEHMKSPLLTQATLIRYMDTNKIGRPSTYSKIIEILKMRGYILENSDKKLIITQIGMLTILLLNGFCESLLNIKLTAFMEEKLDDIAIGKYEYKEVLNEFIQSLYELIKCFNYCKNRLKKLYFLTDIKCIQCDGAKLTLYNSIYGFYSKCQNCNQMNNDVGRILLSKLEIKAFEKELK